VVEAVAYVGQVVWIIHTPGLTKRLQTAEFSPAD